MNDFFHNQPSAFLQKFHRKTHCWAFLQKIEGFWNHHLIRWYRRSVFYQPFEQERKPDFVFLGTAGFFSVQILIPSNSCSMVFSRMDLTNSRHPHITAIKAMMKYSMVILRLEKILSFQSPVPKGWLNFRQVLFVQEGLLMLIK